MLFLILAITLMTLALVMYGVGKFTKRKWLKLLGGYMATFSMLIFLAIVIISFFFPHHYLLGM